MCSCCNTSSTRWALKASCWTTEVKKQDSLARTQDFYSLRVRLSQRGFPKGPGLYRTVSPGGFEGSAETVFPNRGGVYCRSLQALTGKTSTAEKTQTFSKGFVKGEKIRGLHHSRRSHDFTARRTRGWTPLWGHLVYTFPRQYDERLGRAVRRLQEY